ncbi:SpaA isopeptide-forming pilin-related protein [Corynebacterium propinquum]|uniref:SpaA isopeptide-forming pilin-related protein n=1 Tax=Corynebacterium propinquum TaxID=43769 RepID=UPI002543BF74|nr:SpaA isopeptide-forming pilin-related protein [Corynebacterium propinquum]MDK4292931.1 SpaA isopeptide-forming pilin-related protein [Corynebacterium propinquum]
MTRIAQRAIIAACILMLTLGIVPSRAQTHAPGKYNPIASAQTAPGESVAITDVSATGDDDENVAMTLSVLTPIKLDRVQITAQSGFGVAEAPEVNSLTIAGVAYPVDRVEATSDRLVIQTDAEVDLQPGTEIVVQWSKGEEIIPPVESFRVVLEQAPQLDTEALPNGNEKPANSAVADGVDLRSRAARSAPNALDRAAVAQGDPFSRATYDQIPILNKRHNFNTCRKSGNTLKIKRWWEPGAHEAVDLVEVELPNGANVNLDRTPVELYFGSDPKWGWGRIKLQKDVDYSVWRHGNSVFFELARTHMRAPREQESYDVEVELSDTGRGSRNCNIQLYHKQSNSAEEPDNGNPTSPKNFDRLDYSHAKDTCTKSGEMVTATSLWGNDLKVLRQGGTEVVEVKIQGARHLASRVKVTDPGMQLRFGSDKGVWKTLRKDNDYSVSVSGNSVYFSLKNIQKHPNRTDYQVQAQIPLLGSFESCSVELWRKGPEWFDRTTPALNLEVAATPREALQWLPASAENPALPQRCGVNVALVFDTSDSLLQHPQGPKASRAAGLSIINALEGTGSHMAIYNFASPAKRIDSIHADKQSMNDEAGVKKLRDAVDGFKATFKRNEKGGTNYQAGLKQVPKGEFDVVYLITDGLPTTNDIDYPGQGFDNGNHINKSDLSLAVEAANELKAYGTRIETVMVGVPSLTEHILNDGFFNLNRVARNLEKWEKYRDEKYGDYGYPSYIDPQKGAKNDIPSDSVREMIEIGGQIMIADKTDIDRRHFEITNRPDIWRAGIRKTESIAADISSPDAVTLVDEFSKLEKSLRELVLQNCFGSINVTKLIQGENQQVSPGKDWMFETSTVDGKNRIVNGVDGKTLANQVTDTTNDQGNFGRKLNQKNQTAPTAQRIKVVEQQQPGFVLQPYDENKNATCTATVFDRKNNKWKTEDAPVENVDDAAKPGFTVAVPASAIVNCSVVNARVSKLSLTVKKVSFGDDPKPLNGSKFELYKIVGSERSLVSKLEGENMDIRDLELGNRYELVETQAPQGYQLLARPITFNLVRTATGVQQVELIGGAAQYPEVTVSQGTERNQLIMQVANTANPELPRTGGPGLFGLLTIGAAVLLVGIMLTRRAKA